MTRRQALKLTAGAFGAAGVPIRAMQAQPPPVRTTRRTAETSALTVGYEESGNASGFPVVLLHGFPDDVRAYDGVLRPLGDAGYRVIVPYLRGHGTTRLRDTAAPRMGEQAALAQDLLDLLQVLRIERFAVAGYDWGGRAACIVSALHPDRVRAAVIIGGYSIQDVFAPSQPTAPDRERALWYQWYFNTERGRAGLAANRRALCRLLWHEWSPTWAFTDETYDRTAPSFDNPDFVDVVIHSYRHRHGYAPGEPRFAEMEATLAKRPRIDVPAITLYGADDGVAGRPRPDDKADKTVFATLIERRVVEGVGHFMPRERPDVVADALLQLLRGTK